MKSQKKLMNQIIAVTGIACLVLTILTSCQSPQGKSAINQEQAAEVKKGSLILSVDADGYLSLPNQTKLCFDTSGTITEIKVSKGDKVSKGQLLAKLDDTTQRLAIDSAQTDVTIAKNKLQKRICPSPYPGAFEYRDFPGVFDTLESMRKALEEAIKALENQKYDRARKELLLAQDDLDRAQRILSETYIKSFSHGLDEATLISYALEWEKAKTALEKAKEELKKTVIIAPFDGIVADVSLKEGDKLSAMNYATTPIVHLIDLNVMEMKADVDEIDIAKVRLGQEAIITVDALPDIELKGKVVFISPIATIQAGVVSYKVTVNLQHSQNPELKDGMTATAHIIIDRKDNVLLVPERAIKDRGTKPWVRVVRNGTVEPREIILGMTDGKNVEVISGLVEGERVMVEPIRRAVPGLF